MCGALVATWQTVKQCLLPDGGRIQTVGIALTPEVRVVFKSITGLGLTVWSTVTRPHESPTGGALGNETLNELLEEAAVWQAFSRGEPVIERARRKSSRPQKQPLYRSRVRPRAVTGSAATAPACGFDQRIGSSRWLDDDRAVARQGMVRVTGHRHGLAACT